MFSNPIQSALAQVRELQRQVLDRQRFRGYSGEARAASGSIALVAAFILASSTVPSRVPVHLIGWGLVFLAALFINYGAVTYWFLHDPSVKRDFRKLRPTVDVFPPLIVGAVISLALILYGEYRFLFGIWMTQYGLANLASRHVLPRSIAWVGLFYVGAGVCCLLWPTLTFTNPWPMGIVYFIGEWASGLILHFDQRRNLA